MSCCESPELILSQFFSKLHKLRELREGVSSGDGDLINEYLSRVDEALTLFKKAMELDSEGRYWILHLLLASLYDDLILTEPKSIINYCINSYTSLIKILKKVVREWLRFQRELITYLDEVNASEHPMANIFMYTELLDMLAPTDPETHVLKGNIYLNYLKTIKDYERLSGISLSAQAHRAFNRALESFTKAINIDIHNYEAYLGLARLHTQVNNLDKAIENYEHALKLMKSYEPLKELSEVYELRGDSCSALRYLEEAVALGREIGLSIEEDLKKLSELRGKCGNEDPASKTADS